MFFQDSLDLLIWVWELSWSFFFLWSPLLSVCTNIISYFLGSVDRSPILREAATFNNSDITHHSVGTGHRNGPGGAVLRMFLLEAWMLEESTGSWFHVTSHHAWKTYMKAWLKRRRDTWIPPVQARDTDQITLLPMFYPRSCHKVFQVPPESQLPHSQHPWLSPPTQELCLPIFSHAPVCDSTVNFSLQLNPLCPVRQELKILWLRMVW